MAGWLTVLVDDRDYIPISRLKEADSGEQNLTTMMPDQDYATVELYLRGGRYLEHLHTFELTGLHARPERPRIVVSAHVRDQVNVTLRVDGELVETQSFPIPEDVHRINWAPWVLSVLGILLLAGLSYGAFELTDGFGMRNGVPSRRHLSGAASVQPEESAIRDDETEEPEFEPPPAEEEAQDDQEDVQNDDDADAAVVDDPGTEDVAAVDDPDAGDEDVARGPVGETELPVDLIGQPLYFEPESAALLPETIDQLEAVATALSGANVSPVRLQITGHTALFGSEPARQELSLLRAQNVAQALRDRLDRVGSVEVELIPEGVGGEEPVTQEASDQWRNRRVEITVLQ